MFLQLLNQNLNLLQLFNSSPLQNHRVNTCLTCGLTEVLGTDPDGEVLLGLLRKTHALHDLLHCCVVTVL